jgi:hypothetical protein
MSEQCLAGIEVHYAGSIPRSAREILTSARRLRGRLPACRRNLRMGLCITCGKLPQICPNWQSKLLKLRIFLFS